MLHTRRRALRVAAIAAVATAGLVMTAASGTAASNHQGASAAAKSEKEWTQTGTGSSITQSDGSMLSVASVQNSLDKDGAVVAKITLNGNAGTNTATRYDDQRYWEIRGRIHPRRTRCQRHDPVSPAAANASREEPACTRARNASTPSPAR